MAQPWRHPTTGVIYYRARLPRDVHSLIGRSVAVEIAGEVASIKVGSTIKISLRTKDRGEGRQRHASVEAQLQRHWAAAKAGTVTLNQRQVQELAGEWYRDLVSSHEDEPGDADAWAILQDLLAEGLEYLDPSGDGIERPEYDPRQAERILSQRLSLDPWLEVRGHHLDRSTRLRVLEAVAHAVVLAAETLKRRASGDYGPDLTVEQFPVKAQRTGQPIAAPADRSLTACFDGWVKEAQPNTSTVSQWRKHLDDFIAFVGHDDAAAVSRASVVKWKEHLLSVGNAPKTINGSKLACIKKVLKWAVENSRIETNVAQSVSAKRSRKPGEKMREFDDEEAAAILRAAAKEKSPVYRWVPLLCAQSGARVSEICQLRAEDVRFVEDIWVMHIRAEAGSVKTEAAERMVPLHPHVIEQGFLEFVRSVPRGPLFYDPRKRKPDAKKPAAKIVAKNVAAWVHRLGLDVGMAHRKAPNHAWRHRFPTTRRDLGIDEETAKAILGYAAGEVSRNYGSVSLAVKKRVIWRVPLPGVWAPNPDGDRVEGQDELTGPVDGGRRRSMSKG